MVWKNGIPPFKELAHVFASEEAAIKYLVDHEIIVPPTVCGQCGGSVMYRPNSKNHVRCGRRNCIAEHGKRWSQSIFERTFFMGTRKPINELMHLLYLFLTGTSNKQIEIMFGWSSGTVVDWFCFVQQLVSEMVLMNHENYQVGGPGIEVQIDEAKFGKRKYNRRHRVEGVWVFGGVEITPDRKLFLVKVPDRTRTTLFKFIKDFILPGSIIISDGWSSYVTLDEIEDFYYTHETVVHSGPNGSYVNPENNACTNHIEGTWAGLKHLIPPRKRTKKNVQGCLLEFMWRRVHAGDLWFALMEAISLVVYVKDGANNVPLSEDDFLL